MPMAQGKKGRPLQVQDFVCLAREGFGDAQNNRAQALAWFQGQLYVGITRQKAKQRDGHGDGGDSPRRSAGPGASYRDDYLDQPGQIWRYDPQTGRWQKIFVSPLVTLPDGKKIFRDVGYRKMIVFQGASDPAPALYVTTISVLGSLILRSQDGEHFMPVSQPRFEDCDSWSFRALVRFNGRLFTSPAGRIQGERIERNTAERPIVFENTDPYRAPWRAISEVGFGDSTNRTIYDMTSLNDYLYAGTFNPYKGFQIWKTDLHITPYCWQQVVADGAFRGDTNQAATGMCAFDEAIYIGTGRQGLHSAKTENGGSEAAEIIRISPDDRWDLIVGEPRRTFEGMKFPLSGLGPGFDNAYNGIIWKMTEHDGWLYAGTVNTGSFLQVLSRFGSGVRARLLARVLENYLERAAGFHLWRSRNGATWEAVTRAGFGNLSTFGIESMLSTPIGLVIGTVGVTRGTAGRPGGCEVWLGR